LGNLLYKNDACKRQVRETHVRGLAQETWEATVNVMELRKQIILEEQSLEGNYYLVVKSPFIINDKVEGVIGLAVDITDRKKIEALEIENRLQKSNKILAEQIAHDIRSPLASLSMLIQYCKDLPEKEHTMLKNTVVSIETIANNLLEKYKENDKAMPFVDMTTEQYVCIYLGLKEVLERERVKNKETKITFNYYPKPEYKFVFIKGDYSDFCRMMSNLLNNAVEAILSFQDENKIGIIDADFMVKDRNVEISVKDNGKGMPKEMIDNILNDIHVGSTKEAGHGIGMEQIKATLKDMKAQWQIKSTENIGTEITLIFPKLELPEWFADKIVLNKGDTVVVIDEDTSIHEAWATCFQEYLSNITVKYFNQGLEAINFIGSIKEKNKIFLLTDYELKEEGMNGIDVIEKYGLQKRSILVTNAYTSKIKDFNEKNKTIRFFYKEYINDIPVLME
jgi:signal transduction histidine kinase